MISTPFTIDSPGIFAVSIILAILNHLYPHHISIHLEAFLTIRPEAHKSFEIDYQMFTRLNQDMVRLRAQLSQSPKNDPSDEYLTNNRALHAKLNTIQHHLDDQNRTLSKYPDVYFRYYSHINNLTAIKPSIPQAQRMEPVQYHYMSGRMHHTAAQFLVHILPSFVLFVTYLMILLFVGWNYSIFSIKTKPTFWNNRSFMGNLVSFGAPVDPDTITLTQDQPGFIMGLFWSILSVFRWFLLIVPRMLMTTITNTLTSFFGLYYLIYQLIAHLIPDPMKDGAKNVLGSVDSGDLKKSSNDEGVQSEEDADADDKDDSNNSQDNDDNTDSGSNNEEEELLNEKTY